MDVATRLLGLSPQTYDAESRTVDATISRGSPVTRIFGIERLEISKRAINLDRVRQQLVPVLDSHKVEGALSALGTVVSAWVADDALVGRLRFHNTAEGRKAERMIANGEITALSIGYRSEDFEITTPDGDVVDPAVDRAAAFRDDLTFTATRWELLEASLVTVPADSSAVIRSNLFAIDVEMPATPAQAALFRMLTRERMHARYQAALNS